ncbi:MAG: sigma-70 family RNA polymerase sigma factor [Polyangia bacterium]
MSQATPDELVLLQRLLSPEGEATRQRDWRTFVERYERLIARCIWRALQRYGAPRSNEDVDDLIGEVWVTLLRCDSHKLRMFDPDRECKLSTFIGLVATNLTIDKLRRCQLDVSSLDDVGAHHVSLQVRSDSVSMNIEARQEAEVAREAMAQLSLADQRFVRAIFVEEREPAAMARELGVTPTTIYTRKIKVQQKLRRIATELQRAA